MNLNMAAGVRMPRAEGEKVSVDPETFKIINKRLYLFNNRLFNCTLQDLNNDELTLKQRADRA